MLVVARVLFFYYTRFSSQCCRTDVGHGLVKTLFLSLILFLVTHPNYIMLYYVILAECQRMGVHDGLTRNTGGR